MAEIILILIISFIGAPSIYWYIKSSGDDIKKTYQKLQEKKLDEDFYQPWLGR